MIYKLDNGGIVKLQNAWTTMPSVEDAILRAWSNQSAKEKAEKQVASEKPKYTYVNPYDYLHGWREATEDAAKQDKYTVENLGGSKEEAEAAYNAAKENAAKQLAGTTATGLGTVALLGLSGGAAGPVAADIVNTGFGAHGLYNALSGNGIQKTVRLANQGDTWGAVKSGAGDLLDLSMGLHAAKLWGNLGKSMLAGQSFGNAYRGNVAGREMLNSTKKAIAYGTPIELNKAISFTPTPQKSVSTVHFDPRVKPLSRPISEAEIKGKPKIERNIKQHGIAQAPYYDYSLINRNYEPWTIDEYGRFVFDSPEKSKKLATIHFSLNEPVWSHIQGSWDDAPTTILLPYRNIRSQTRPVDIAIMDTFFPNYNGLKISSRGTKVLTGDKSTFDYYMGKGVDVEFSPELESLISKLKSIRKELDKIPDKERYANESSLLPEPIKTLNNEELETMNKMDEINRAWTELHAKKIPSFDKLNEFGKAEGLNLDKYPYMLGSPKRDYYGNIIPESSDKLNYTWVSDPSNHSAMLMNPKYLLESINRGEYEATPEYKKFVEWLVNHKADYRKQGGILKAQNGTPGFITPMTNQFTTKLMEFLEKYRRKGPAPQKAVGPVVWAYSKSSKIADDGGKIS